MPDITFRVSNKHDIDYILQCNHAIEGDAASLTKERLLGDIICPEPKAKIYIFEYNKLPIGLIFYSHTYWASRGLIMWISQLYIEPAQRGRFIFQVKNWILDRAANDNASMIGWGTITDATRSNKLWQAIGAKNINEHYQFWVKKIGDT